MTVTGRHATSDRSTARPDPQILSSTTGNLFADVLADHPASPTGQAEGAEYVRIGGIKIRTERLWRELNDDAETLTGWKGRRARAALRREQRLRRASIERVVDLGGFDRPIPMSGGRGFSGPGGGRMRSVARLPEWRATTTQAGGGFWPFSIGASAPMLGTPLGAHAITGADVGFDPIVWFDAGGLINAPITFVLALNGFGKSSLVRRMATGIMAQNHTCLFMGDTKSEYTDLTGFVGGQQIGLSYSRGTVNPLAAGGLGSVIGRLNAAIAATTDPARRAELEAKCVGVSEQVRARQVQMVNGLLQLVRSSPIEDFEETLVRVALDRLYSPDGGGFDYAQPPILSDLYNSIDGNDEQLWPKVGADDLAQYRLITRKLRQSLNALIDGNFGRVFNAHTSHPIDIDAPAICVDVSDIDESDGKLLAAVLMVCWSDGFGAVEAAHTLSDVGLAPRRNFLVVMDELWRVLGAGAGMVDRVNALTRLNRTKGTALIMITHTMKDLGAFDSAADVNNAQGFIERAPAKIIGPVGPDEIRRLKAVTKFTATEERWLTSLASTPPPSPATIRKIKQGHRQKPTGLGCFLLKYGTSDEQIGMPFQTTFTPTENQRGVHNTNSRWGSAGAAPTADADQRGQ